MTEVFVLMRYHRLCVIRHVVFLWATTKLYTTSIHIRYTPVAPPPPVSRQSEATTQSICHGCLAALPAPHAGYPCDSCSLVLYCDPACRTRHTAQHGPECGQPWSALLPTHAVLAARMLRATPAALTAHMATLAATLPGEVEAVLATATAAAVTVLCEAGQHADYAGLVSRTARCFVGILQVQCNGIAVLPPPCIPPSSCFYHQPPPVGLAVFPTLSMVNHSCRPTAHMAFHWGRGLTAALRAIQPITAGAEACISYGPQVGERITATRQDALRQQYGFVCSCQACAGMADMHAMVGVDAGGLCG